MGTGLTAIVPWLIGSTFIAPCNHKVDPPPADLPCEAVKFHSGSAADIHGWFVDAKDARAAVLLLHASGGDRTSMLRRARFLHQAGYAALMIDFRCHGESIADVRTYGWRESLDAISSVGWLRHRMPDNKIAVIGFSLGGAAAILAGDKLNADALVAESVYGDLRKAIWNRVEMRIGTFGADCLSPLLTMQVPSRMNLKLDDVSPARSAACVPCPVLVIHGALDHHAHVEEGRAIFDACPNSRKEWWEVADAGHEDLCRHEGEIYERKVLAFLHRALDRAP